jgi:vancomycin resistance protein YoaR
MALVLGAAASARAQEPNARPSFAPTDTAEARIVETPDRAEEEFPVVLGSFTTTLAGSRPDRTANVKLAAAALDGKVLEDGQVLSFDAVVGPRTLERGYREAPVILHESRQLQTGGGVCQVASTMFVAGLLSGLSTVERWRHSSPVDYIALGHDATIAWGSKDLKLRNDTGERVRVRTLVRGATLSVRFEGERPLAETFELATEERELPAEAGVEGARPGREIELYRVRHGARGGESRELVLRDTYPPSRGEKPEQ